MLKIIIKTKKDGIWLGNEYIQYYQEPKNITEQRNITDNIYLNQIKELHIYNDELNNEEYSI